MKVTQYLPASLELDLPRFEGEVSDLAHLTQLKWVQRWWAAPGFYQFSRSLNPSVLGRSPPPTYLLLAEFEGGARYYVVALLSGPDLEAQTRALPLWKVPANTTRS
jgi:hypothetical protein